ncbi:MAG: LuxR C-terminal-related transcriptional regulator [Oscillospiraceae bacterium]
MEYITAKQAAEQWQTSTRWVQRCCKSGAVVGAQHHGREWMIPAGAGKPKTADQSAVAPVRIPMPLLNSTFAPGQCKEWAEHFFDEGTRDIALAEYYYFSGQSEKACAAAEPYLNHEDEALRLSAYLIYAYANLSLGRTQLSRRALRAVMDSVKQNCRPTASPQMRAVSIFIANTASVLLHLNIPGIPPMEAALPALPQGLRFFSCYITAHLAYLAGDYNRSLGITQAAFAVAETVYPIPAIYLHLIAAMDEMNLKHPEEGKAEFYKAWALAKQDDLIEAFGEHHGLLEGLVEVCLKKSTPKAFERIIAITYSFSDGWRQIHNPHTQEEVADNLSTLEFTIAMLANRGWSNKAIADHLDLSASTVKAYSSQIYQKLGIDSRKDLQKYMLR